MTREVQVFSTETVCTGNTVDTMYRKLSIMIQKRISTEQLFKQFPKPAGKKADVGHEKHSPWSHLKTEICFTHKNMTKSD